MPSIPEAVPGTIFLVPIVYLLVTNESFIATFPIEAILTLAALFAFPVGWLCLNLQGLYLAYRHGRYENEPVMSYIRKHIQVKKENGKYTIDLDQVLPPEFERRSIACCQQEFDKLFDPFKTLRCIPFSFRKRQSEREVTLFYVENVENITFFSPKVPSQYIREIIGYWHIAYSSGIAVILGLICGIGLYFFLGGNVLGIVPAIFVAVFLTMTGGLVQPHLRKKEAIANEYLLVKLLVPFNEPKT